MKIVILIVNKSEILQKSMLNIQGPPKSQPTLLILQMNRNFEKRLN